MTTYSIFGAGPAGLYTAWRLATSGKAQAGDRIELYEWGDYDFGEGSGTRAPAGRICTYFFRNDMHPGKTGQIAEGTPPVLKALGISEHRWQGQVCGTTQFNRATRTALGTRNRRRQRVRANAVGRAFARISTGASWTGGYGASCQFRQRHGISNPIRVATSSKKSRITR